MDINDTNLEDTTTEDSFGIQIAKAVAISAASYAGAFAALVVVGAVTNTVVKIKEKRNAKKTPELND